ncbi:MAG TPA: RT0821/Lpp0805 family surface protein [Paraburkholderia sp.]|uniref:RT0821/Lpp0805 family surface protein n=1 Tax=Paraburkholderia sp. TaxID=1926495 RepID=UPI002CD21869|nr:RT0821/Lpp0805 family surface protein [Paraburkholderia sp.]HTR10549.1 RT0821/Lpp0805 family surface protein [Paraburkholderia sp.]
MNNWLWTLASISLAGAVVAGCAQNGSSGMNNTTSGALVGGGVGAALGGIFGHGNAGAIVAGGLVGGLLGGVIGHEMDERDREARERAVQAALQSSKNDQAKTWHNSKTGNSGTIKPLSGYTSSPSAQTCRDFQETYVKAGQTYQQTARACRNSKGEWQLAN